MAKKNKKKKQLSAEVKQLHRDLERKDRDLDRLVEKEQIGEKRPYVNRGVQVVHQLRPYGLLCEDEFHGGS